VEEQMMINLKIIH